LIGASSPLDFILFLSQDLSNFSRAGLELLIFCLCLWSKWNCKHELPWFPVLVFDMTKNYASYLKEIQNLEMKADII
jgi:hypothetical protein